MIAVLLNISETTKQTKNAAGAAHVLHAWRCKLLFESAPVAVRHLVEPVLARVAMGRAAGSEADALLSALSAIEADLAVGSGSTRGAGGAGGGAGVDANCSSGSTSARFQYWAMSNAVLPGSCLSFNVESALRSTSNLTQSGLLQ